MRTLHCLFLLFLCGSVAVQAADVQLWTGTYAIYTLSLYNTPPCGLKFKLSGALPTPIELPIDIAVQSSVCTTVSGVSVCFSLQNFTKDASGQVHPCIFLSISGTQHALGCITSANTLAQCLVQGCPNGCSGHGTCLDSGICSCNNNYYGDDCSMLQPLFDECITTPTYGDMCLQLKFEECEIDALVYSKIAGIPIPLYRSNISAPEFNTYFDTPVCFHLTGTSACQACLYFNDYTLTDTVLHGCPAVNVSAACNLPISGEMEYDCFTDSSLVPACFGDNCPLGCSGHGTCTNGHCVCTPPYIGAGCSEFSCANVFDCYGHGECVAPDSCKCNTGYFGDWCQGAKCDSVNNCNGNGACYEPNICTCDKGFNGTTCTEVVCADACLNGGKCEKGKCKCTSEWAGSNCGTAVTKKDDDGTPKSVYVVVGVVVGVVVASAAGTAAFFAWRWRRSKRTGGFSSFDDGLIQVPDTDEDSTPESS